MTLQDAITDALRSEPPVEYCDYIADTIRRRLGALATTGQDGIIATVYSVTSHLHPYDGYLLTTRKTIDVVDVNGQRYRVTVEAV